MSGAEPSRPDSVRPSSACLPGRRRQCVFLAPRDPDHYSAEPENRLERGGIERPELGKILLDQTEFFLRQWAAGAWRGLGFLICLAMKRLSTARYRNRLQQLGVEAADRGLRHRSVDGSALVDRWHAEAFGFARRFVSHAAVPSADRSGALEAAGQDQPISRLSIEQRHPNIVGP
jgi:hypothetical protein